jgi:hypothetical protein
VRFGEHENAVSLRSARRRAVGESSICLDSQRGRLDFAQRQARAVRGAGKVRSSAAMTSPYSPAHTVAALAKFGGADVRSW